MQINRTDGFYQALLNLYSFQSQLWGAQIQMDWVTHRITHSYWLTNRVNFVAKLVSYYNFFGIQPDAHQPPFFYMGGPAAFNYGAIGSILAEEVLSAIDIMGM